MRNCRPVAILSGVVFIFYLTIAWLNLYLAAPNEDAFILFKFDRRLRGLQRHALFRADSIPVSTLPHR